MKAISLGIVQRYASKSLLIARERQEREIGHHWSQGTLETQYPEELLQIFKGWSVFV